MMVQSIQAFIHSGPSICWTFEADQTTNVAKVAFVHGASYELFEVRNEYDLFLVHRLGDRLPKGTLETVRQDTIDVLTKTRGDDGQTKRIKHNLNASVRKHGKTAERVSRN